MDGIGNPNAKSSASPKAKDGLLSYYWMFTDKRLTVSRLEDANAWRGAFSLSVGAERKLFDFAGANQNGRPMEFLGIYEFEGDFLRICWRTRSDPNDTKVKRPDSFVLGPGDTIQYRKLRRLGDR